MSVIIKTMSQTQITTSFKDGIATILLNAPYGKPPTLDIDVLDELEQCIDEVSKSGSSMLLVRSNSDRFFCVGADIYMLKELNDKTIVPWVMQGHAVLNKLEDMPMPVVAVVEGYAMGGGLELALACDLIFAEDNANFAQSEATLGFIPGWGGCSRLPLRVGYSKAKYLFYSGKMVNASEAERIGLVDFSGSKTKIENEITEFSSALKSANRNALCKFKKILNDQQRNNRDMNASIEAFESVSCLQNADTKNRLQKFLSKKEKV
jgi:enoyl-CoA hydratase